MCVLCVSARCDSDGTSCQRATRNSISTKTTYILDYWYNKMRNTCYKLLHGCPLNDRMARVCVFRSYTYYLYECSNQESGMHVISCVLVVQLRQQFCRRVRKKEKTWKCHIGGPAGIACPMLNHFTFNTGREEKGRWNEIVGKRCRLICMAMSSHAACHTHTHTAYTAYTRSSCAHNEC